MFEHHPVSPLLTSAMGPTRQQSWRELAHTKVIPKKKVNAVQYKTDCALLGGGGSRMELSLC